MNWEITSDICDFGTVRDNRERIAKLEEQVARLIKAVAQLKAGEEPYAPPPDHPTEMDDFVDEHG